MKKKHYLMLSIVLLITLKSFAWGDEGHRIVAGIAYEMLSPKTRAKLSCMFPYGQVIDMSNYPDRVKADTTHRFDKYSAWHFLDIEPDQLSFADYQKYVLADTVPNAYRAILHCIQQLKLHPADTFYLAYLVHLVGDVHQSLHQGRLSDEGGNKIMIAWEGARTNLHSLWDSGLITALKFGNGDFARVLMDKYAKQQRVPLYAEGKLFEWMYQSYQRRTAIYDSVKYLVAASARPARSDYFYIYYYSATLYESLYAGGIHLASILNSIYG